jgi:opacity protein-like surface antigen
MRNLVNLSNVSTIDNQDAASSRLGFNAGAYGDYFFSERWSLKLKLLYDQKGFADGFFFDSNGTFTTDFVLGYLTTPVMANWHFGKNRNWYLNFGPHAGFLLSAKTMENDIDVKEAFNSTDFGLALGLGVKFAVSDSSHLFIEYAGQSGFSDIFKDNEGDAVRNGRSSLNLGITF